MSFAFTSRYDSTNIQRNFYRILKEQGIFVKKVEADYPKEVKPNYEGKKVFQIFNFLLYCSSCSVYHVKSDPDTRFTLVDICGSRRI